MNDVLLTRRRALALGGLAVTLVACGDNDDDAVTDASTTTTSADDTKSSDIETARVAASLELLAINTYKAAADAATAGKLGPVPPAVATFVTTASTQHQEAKAAWDEVITAADGASVTEPPADLAATVQSEFAKVTDLVGAVKLALLLEEVATSTYLAAQSSLENGDAITLAGALQSSGQERVSILRFVLGEYPVPETFQTTTKAYKPTSSGASGSTTSRPSASTTTDSSDY